MFFFFNDKATNEIYTYGHTLSLHDALPILSRPEISAILEAPDRLSWAGQRGRALFSMMYNTGARVSEMIGMRCRDVVLGGQPAAHLRGKGRKERSVPLWRPTAALIRSWRRQIGDPSGDSILFPNRSGRRLNRHNVTQRLNLDVATAGRKNPGLLDRPVTPHTVRHTTRSEEHTSELQSL